MINKCNPVKKCCLKNSFKTCFKGFPHGLVKFNIQQIECGTSIKAHLPPMHATCCKKCTKKKLPPKSFVSWKVSSKDLTNLNCIRLKIWNQTTIKWLEKGVSLLLHLIIFESLLNTFESSIIFLDNLGRSNNSLKPKNKLPKQCPCPRNDT